jgi:hypothetical protein
MPPKSASQCGSTELTHCIYCFDVKINSEKKPLVLAGDQARKTAAAYRDTRYIQAKTQGRKAQTSDAGSWRCPFGDLHIRQSLLPELLDGNIQHRSLS